MASKKNKAARKKKTARASDTRNGLDSMPMELFCLVIEQFGLSIRDLISLALTSRGCYERAIPTAYKRHVKEEHGIAIYWAVQNEQYDTLERLIENGVDIDLANEKVDDQLGDDDPTSFFEKFKNTRVYMEVDRLSTFTPLALAASLGLDNMVQFLLDHGADIEHFCTYLCDCSSHFLYTPFEFPSRPFFPDGEEDWPGDMSWWKPLHYAICKGHESTAKLLIARGASVKQLALFEKGVTALHVATRWGKENIIDHLLDNKLVDIDASSSNFWHITPLHIAYVAENFTLVDKYLDLGADINIAYDGWNIFAMACGEGRFDKALQYLQRGADPGFVLESNEYEPWTAMRFIYEHRDTRSAHSMRDKVALEQEIFKASGGNASGSTASC